jgi:hypothetical protein
MNGQWTFEVSSETQSRVFQKRVKQKYKYSTTTTTTTTTAKIKVHFSFHHERGENETFGSI